MNHRLRAIGLMVLQSLLGFSEHLMTRSTRAFGSRIDSQACRYSDTSNHQVEEFKCGQTAPIITANSVMD